MDNIFKLAKSIQELNISNLGPTASQEAYVFKKARLLADELLKKDSQQIRVNIPSAGGYERLYITVYGTYSFIRGDDETGEPSTLTLYSTGGCPYIEFETDEVEIEAFSPHPGFKEIPF